MRRLAIHEASKLAPRVLIITRNLYFVAKRQLRTRTALLGDCRVRTWFCPINTFEVVVRPTMRKDSSDEHLTPYEREIMMGERLVDVTRVPGAKVYQA